MSKRAGLLSFVLIFAVALAALVARPQTGFSATGENPHFYTTGKSAERVKTIPIAVRGKSPSKRVVYSIQLAKGVRVGDLIDVTVDMEATNPHKYNAMYGSSVVLSESAGSTTGQVVAKATAFNITPDMHHGKDIRVGRVKATKSGRLHVNYVAWSAASRASSGDTMKIEQNYGNVTIVNWGPSA